MQRFRMGGALALLLLLICFASMASAARRPLADVSVKTPILGAPVATRQQCVSYLLRVNPKPSLTVSVQALVDFYYEEGRREGVRPDVAFAQALQETGHFRYGGLVQPKQNNFCGLGSMGRGAHGASFKTAQLGVRAHVQHILAYASTRKPRSKIVDPRYDHVKTTQNFGKAKTWMDLNGRWAIPGKDYAQRIFGIYEKILQEPRKS